MKNSRIDQIEKYIEAHKAVSVSELSETFHVSIVTIRRDLRVLRNLGKIDTVYGGARIHTSPSNVNIPLRTYQERTIKNSNEKQIVADAASSLIKENDIIFIDTGTSTVPLARHLGSFHQLTIVTNSVHVLHLCLDYPQLTVLSLPGMLKSRTASLVGEFTERMIDTLNIDKAFMACSAFSLEQGASNSSIEDSPIKRKIMSRSKSRYLLLDHTKLENSGLTSFAAADQFDGIVTDQPLPEKYNIFFHDNNISVIIAKP